jgi:hypothetical protein
MVDFAWIFFRAYDTHEAVQIIKSILTVNNPWILFNGSLYNCGLNAKNFWLMIYGLVVLVIADYFKHKGISIRQWIIGQDYWFRWIFISLAIVIILTFGIWGPNYNASNFIYFQF